MTDPAPSIPVMAGDEVSDVPARDLNHALGPATHAGEIAPPNGPSIDARVPQLLVPMLAERGFACEVDESLAHIVTVRIWRAR